LICFRWVLRETNLLIKSDERRAIDVATRAALRARQQIEQFVSRYPEFRYSLEPLRLKSDECPRVIKLMLKAGEIADVGPFAAVAGAISQVASEAATEAGARNILVENGGDISINGNQQFVVGIYAGRSKLSGRIGFLLGGEDLPAGICTSSGTVGHSISFGDADAVVVVADEASIADAAATSIANEVKGKDIELSIKRGLDRADDISEIRGCLIFREDRVGLTGKLPRFIFTQKAEVEKMLGLVTSQQVKESYSVFAESCLR